MELYFIALFLLILGGLISIKLKDEIKLKFCFIISLISTALILKPSLISLLKGEVFIKNIYFSPVFQDVSFVLDPLSAFFALIVSFIGLFGILYSTGYLKSEYNKNKNLKWHGFFLMTLIASMLSVFVVQNSLLFLVFWEIMSLSSFFLVIFEGDKKEVLNAGIKYLVYMHISVIFIMLAFLIAGLNSESLNFSDFATVLNQNKQLANTVFLLAFLGFGTKAGFVPFHNWLPKAHPAAPSHVSGIMSGVMIKTGIYGILRTLCLIGFPTKFAACLVLSVSVISALWGVLYAIAQHDIKKLLAYHSLENIGIIGMGLGIGLMGLVYNNYITAFLGFAGGILHILNHSIFKSLLFFAAGNVYKMAHTRNVELLGGLIKKMPYTAILFLTGSIAICALPPFNGFISEFLIYIGLIKGIPSLYISSFVAFVITLGALALIGTMAILCFTKVFGVVFLGEGRSENVKSVNSDVSKRMLFPMSILALLTLLIGVFPQFAIRLISKPLDVLLGDVEIMTGAIAYKMQLLSFIFLIFIVIFSFIFAIKFLLNKNMSQHTTWGCGYNKPNSKMQYTASSYADLFVSTLKPLFKRITHIKKPKDLFPKEAFYEVEIEDIEEAYIVKPLVKFDEKFLSKFEKIQNGNMQQYIQFGLIFLILSLFGLFVFGGI